MSSCIVCGIDDSTEAARAAAVASRLARDLGSRAVLVHVADGAHSSWALRRRPVGRARRARNRLKAIAEEYCFPAGTRMRLEAGDPAEELLAVTAQEDAELVVVSSQGEGRISAALLGGVSSALIHACPCPVVVVPPRAVPPLDSEGIRTVVCGVAGNDQDLPALRLAADLAARLRGALHAVHAYDPRALHAVAPAAPAPPVDMEVRDAAERQLKGAIHDAAVEAETHLMRLSPALALAQVARERRAGLLVVGPPRRPALTTVLGGSVPIQLAADGDTPIVVPPPAVELGLGSGHYEVEPATA